MKRILTLALLSLCGCVGRAEHKRDILFLIRQGNISEQAIRLRLMKLEEFQDKFSGYELTRSSQTLFIKLDAETEARLKALEDFVQAARDREEQSRRYQYEIIPAPLPLLLGATNFSFENYDHSVTTENRWHP